MELTILSHELSVILSYSLAAFIMAPLFASRVWRWRKLRAQADAEKSADRS